MLVKCEQGTIDSERYIGILKRFLIPKLDLNRHVFMQDGARPHTAKVTTEMLANEGVTLVEWPAKSPDLNPIETVWGIMTARIDVDHCVTVDELSGAIDRAWDSVSQEEINKLVEGFENRVLKMIERGGQNIQVKECYLGA